MTNKEVERFRIFEFDDTIIAATTEEEAIKIFNEDLGFTENKCLPTREFSLDTEIIIPHSEGKHFCPFCKVKWDVETYRSILKSWDKDDLPGYII